MRLAVFTIIAPLLFAAFVVEAAGAADPAPSDSVWADYTDIVKDRLWEFMYERFRTLNSPSDTAVTAWRYRGDVFAMCVRSKMPWTEEPLPPRRYEEAYYDRGVALCDWWLVHRYSITPEERRLGIEVAELPDTLTAAEFQELADIWKATCALPFFNDCNHPVGE